MSTTLDSVRHLEDEFAAAMTQMYAVGNDLARLRRTLADEQPAAAGPATAASSPPTSAAAASAPTTASPVAGAPRRPEWPAAPRPDQAAAPTAGAARPAAPAPAMAGPAPVAPGAAPAPGAARPGGTRITPPPLAAGPHGPVPPMPPPGLGAPQVPWWRRASIATVLAAVGGAITLIGVAFLVAIAIQMGLFGPAARVIAGGLLAAGLVGAGLLVAQRQRSTTGSVGLVGTGLAAAYLDILAVTRIYEWVPAAAGLVLAALVTGGGLLLARRWERELLGLLTVLGAAALAPAVGWPDGVLVGGFLVLLTAATWPVQIGHRWHLLELARVLPTSLVVLTLAPVSGDGEHRPLVLALLLMAIVLSTTLLGLRHGRLSPQLGALALVATLPALLAATLDDRWIGTVALLLVVAAHGLVAWLAPSVEALHLRLAEVSIATAGLASVLAAVRAGDSGQATATLLATVALAWVLITLVLRQPAVLATAAGTAAIALIAALPVMPQLLIRSLAEDTTLADLLTVLVITAALAVAALGGWRHGLERALLMTLGGSALFATGAVAILAATLLGQRLGSAEAGFVAGQATATVLWLAAAAAMLVIGTRRSIEPLVPASLLLAAGCAGKLILFDLAFLDGIARVASFIVGGLLLLVMGVGFASLLDRDRGPKQGPGGPTGAAPGHPGGPTGAAPGGPTGAAPGGPVENFAAVPPIRPTF
ncbi:DUF2339 domain-containing protein [Janibacter alkaliphilus]|uniref:Putative membrane protein n=1 Tax=Janibacter alkaliphilus TaxID=1069963 RepID=A0A852X107_9MICO|nr:DUF2339 domain-containing protein [Janibacter alkaliphilus]NYG37002.1 putative membrane protein [Janibacter alkaliphilus]